MEEITQHDKALIFEGLYALMVGAKEAAFVDFASIDNVTLRACASQAAYTTKDAGIEGEPFARMFFDSIGALPFFVKRSDMGELVGDFMKFFDNYDGHPLNEVWLRLFHEECNVRND